MAQALLEHMPSMSRILSGNLGIAWGTQALFGIAEYCRVWPLLKYISNYLFMSMVDRKTDPAISQPKTRFWWHPPSSTGICAHTMYIYSRHVLMVR